MNRLRLLSVLAAAGLLPVLAPAQTATLQTTVIESDGPGEMVSTDTETTITFRDNVRVTGTNMKLSCDYLEVVVVRTGDKTATLGKLDKFRSMLATGNVRMIQGDREAACGRAEVLPGDDKIILTGQPVVVDHSVNWTWTGDELEMLRNQRQIRGKNARFTGPPIKDLGADKAKAPEATPSPETPKAP
jgi:lipopolysaccharide export system protein LptA